MALLKWGVLGGFCVLGVCLIVVALTTELRGPGTWVLLLMALVAFATALACVNKEP